VNERPAAEQEAPERPLVFGLGRTVFALGWVSLLTDLSSEMIFPVVLPLFLREVLKASYGFIGLIEGVADSTASLLRVISGWVSDLARSRKPLVALGYGLSTVVKPILYLVRQPWHALVLRFGDRVGKGIRSAPRDALIASAVDPKIRGRAFGFHRAMDTLGAVGGPLLALLLLRLLAPGGKEHAYRMIFLIAGIPAALAVLAIFIGVHERAPAAAPAGAVRLSLSGFGRRFRLFLIVAAVFSIGNSSDIFLVLRARHLGMDAATLLLVYVIFNIVSALLSTPAGVLSDRIGRGRVLVIGYLVFAGVYLGFALVQTMAAVWALFLVYGVYSAATEGIQRAFAADLSPAHLRGTGLGIYHTVTGVALLPASVIAGLLWGGLPWAAGPADHPARPFIYGAITAGLAAVLLLIWFGGGKQSSGDER
jgi:MFS family permease